jgi:pimeloyl-ACP methyl ester carboxylesterase
VPAVVVAGTADRLTPLVHARRIADALPRCLELVELAGMGHMTPVEAPEVVTAKIRELVATFVNADATASVDATASANVKAKEEAA